ncbi:MAG: response regulator [Lachnospiraceae bacterium]|nr:response regulator [Lachnospiraceae bacterium]
MEKDVRVILIGGRGFMITSIKNELQNQGLETVHTEPSVTELEKHKGPHTVYLLYIEDIDSITDIIVYLKDRITEDKASVNIIGDREDFKEVEHILPRERLTGIFERPINVKDLAAHMSTIVNDEETKSYRGKILVVDDDGTMLRTIDTWLSDKYEVFMANSGIAAITLLAKKQVDLILLDYEMPVTDGPKVLEMLKSDASTESIPVMFLTNKSDRESVMNVINLKPEKYLLKTMSREELLLNIDEFFEKQKAQKY